HQQTAWPSPACYPLTRSGSPGSDLDHQAAATFCSDELEVSRQTMKIESIRLKNFRAFRDVEMRDLPGFCVLIGANGTGKSTLFSVFSFLRDAMSTNVTAALGKLGGSRGFQEVRSRN